MLKRLKNIQKIKSALGIFMLLFFLSVSVVKIYPVENKTTTSSVVVKKQASKTILKSANASEDSYVFQDENEIEENEIDDVFLRIGSFSFAYFFLPFKDEKNYSVVPHKKNVTAELYTLYCNWKLHLL